MIQHTSNYSVTPLSEGIAPQDQLQVLLYRNDVKKPLSLNKVLHESALSMARKFGSMPGNTWNEKKHVDSGV